MLRSTLEARMHGPLEGSVIGDILNTLTHAWYDINTSLHEEINLSMILSGPVRMYYTPTMEGSVAYRSI